MTPYAAEAYRSITGEDPPKPFHERTLEEQLQARDAFLKLVRESSDEDDAAVDEFFRNIRMDLHLQAPDFSDFEEESA